MGSERHSWDYGDPIRNMGRKPSPGARLHLLRRGLIHESLRTFLLRGGIS